MKKLNKLLVIGLIILLIIIIILCIIIKKLSFKPKTNNNIKTEIKDQVKPNKDNKTKSDDSLFNDSNSYERVNSSENKSTVVNNYYYITNEGDVINYIDGVVDEATTVKEKSKLTKAFETLSDFIFYNGTIKGYTFDELSDSGKEKVMNAWNRLDSYIESKYPDYKSSLKDGVMVKKEKIEEVGYQQYMNEM